MINWLILGPHLPQPLRKAKYIFLAYKYIHQYPQQENTCVLGISSTTLKTKIIPVLSILAQTLNEIFWEDRLDPYNHAPDFPYYVTCMVDTIPIYVQNPTNAIIGRWLYNPKYGSAIYKGQFAIDFLGRFVLATGLNTGLYYDGSILLIFLSGNNHWCYKQIGMIRRKNTLHCLMNGLWEMGTTLLVTMF